MAPCQGRQIIELEEFVMAKILVVYCSLSGNTEVAAQAVADGA